jgi:hypothetical protein
VGGEGQVQAMSGGCGQRGQARVRVWAAAAWPEEPHLAFASNVFNGDLEISEISFLY